MKEEGLGGMMVWELSQDDFNGSKCNEGRYPLIAEMKNELLQTII